MSIEANSPAIFELVAEDAEVEQLATGFTFTEGQITELPGLDGLRLHRRSDLE